jgi:hypothetical protein
VTKGIIIALAFVALVIICVASFVAFSAAHAATHTYTIRKESCVSCIDWRKPYVR